MTFWKVIDTLSKNNIPIHEMMDTDRDLLCFRLEYENITLKENDKVMRRFITISKELFSDKNIANVLLNLTLQYRQLSIHEIMYSDFVQEHGIKYFIDIDIDMMKFSQIMKLCCNEKYMEYDVFKVYLDKEQVCKYLYIFLKQHIILHLETIIKGFPNTHEKLQFTFYSSMDEEMKKKSKYGIHMILQNFIIKDVRIHKEITRQLNLLTFGELNDFFDSAVYENNKSLRILNSHKTMEASRRKMVAYFDDKKHTMLVRPAIFSDMEFSFLTYTYDLSKIIYINIGMKKQIRQKLSTGCSSYYLELIKNYVEKYNKLNLDDFEVQENQKWGLFLQRTRPSICIVHGVRHDKQNAYLNYSIKEDGKILVHYMCFQDYQGSKKSKILGVIDDSGNPLTQNQENVETNPLLKKYDKNAAIFKTVDVVYDEVYGIETERDYEKQTYKQTNYYLLQPCRLKGTLDQQETTIDLPECNNGDDDLFYYDVVPTHNEMAYCLDKKDILNYLFDDSELTQQNRYKINNAERSVISHVCNFNKQMERKMLIWKAPMKTGKTKLLINGIIQKYNDYYASINKIPVIVILSFRRTFTKEFEAKINKSIAEHTQHPERLYFIPYNDDKGKSFLQHNCIIIQIESLYKLKDWIFKKNQIDLLIMDEVESILDQTNSGLGFNPGDSMEFFKKVCNMAQRIICMDANVTKSTEEFAKSVGFNEENTLKINVMGVILDNKYTIYGDYSQMLTDMIDVLLNKNKRIVVVTNSKENANMIEMYLRRQLPHKDIKNITSDNSKEYIGQKNSNIENELTADVLIYTPTITAGISFEKKWYNEIFGIFASHSCNVETFIQMMGRVRDFQEVKLYFDRIKPDYKVKQGTNVKTLINMYSNNDFGIIFDASQMAIKIGLYRKVIANMSLLNPLHRFLHIMRNTYVNFDNVTKWANPTEMKIKGVDIHQLYIERNKNVLDRFKKLDREKISKKEIKSLKQKYVQDKADDCVGDDQYAQLQDYEYAEILNSVGILDYVMKYELSVSHSMHRISFVNKNLSYYKLFYNGTNNNQFDVYVHEHHKDAHIHDTYKQMGYIQKIMKMTKNILGQDNIEFIRYLPKYVDRYHIDIQSSEKKNKKLVLYIKGKGRRSINLRQTLLDFHLKICEGLDSILQDGEICAYARISMADKLHVTLEKLIDALFNYC